MDVFRSLAEVKPAGEGRSIALGTFDGVHRGHRRVIGTAVEHAREQGLRPIVVTFDPHPLRVLQPDDPPPLLTDTAAKAEIAGRSWESTSCSRSPSRPSCRSMEPEDFIAEVLVGALGTRQVSVGANFRFGHGARGDVDLLRVAAGVRDRGRAAGRVRRRAGLLQPHPRAGRRRRRAPPRRTCSARLTGSRARWSPATRAAASSTCGRRTSRPRRAS